MLSRTQSLSLRTLARPLTIGYRRAHTNTMNSKKEGDISSVFVSLSGNDPLPLPPRFSDVKRGLIQGHKEQVIASWRRLLEVLKREATTIEKRGSSVIPSIHYDDLLANSKEFRKDLKEKGVAVIRGVVPQKIARAYKEEVEQYVRANPGTKAFPPGNPQVFELYWSLPQLEARAHPNLLSVQRLLMDTWHSNDSKALISTKDPVIYADRVRIRQPGDATFALGPHVDAGSVERWETNGYGISGVYDSIWKGDWENYDPWESSCRLTANTDLYGGPGACSMFRMFQGWLSMSRTGPHEGTLLVNPMLRLATAYYLLRPFFNPTKPATMDAFGKYTGDYLHADNWSFQDNISPVLQGATPGHSQELNEHSHPHLNLSKTMVHIPSIEPGDYVIWHCDVIHAVDKVHNGSADSSVLYIPSCPLTERNAEYLARQREAFLKGEPGPDFPGGLGESKHVGRPTVNCLKSKIGKEGLRALGFGQWSDDAQYLSDGESQMLDVANTILAVDKHLAPVKGE